MDQQANPLTDDVEKDEEEKDCLASTDKPKDTIAEQDEYAESVKDRTIYFDNEENFHKKVEEIEDSSEEDYEEPTNNWDVSLSKSTLHESEAEIKLMEAMEGERTQSQSSNHRHRRGNSWFSTATTSTATTTTTDNRLAAQTQYLLALHSKSDRHLLQQPSPLNSTNNNNNNNNKDFNNDVRADRGSPANSPVIDRRKTITHDLSHLAEAHPTDRIAMAGPVLFYPSPSTRKLKRNTTLQQIDENVLLTTSHDHPLVEQGTNSNKNYNLGGMSSIQYNSWTSFPPPIRDDSISNNNNNNNSSDLAWVTAEPSTISGDMDIEAPPPPAPPTASLKSQQSGDLPALPPTQRPPLPAGWMPGRVLSEAIQTTREELLHFQVWEVSRRRDWVRPLIYSNLIFWPCLIVSILLFYGFHNPPTGYCSQQTPDGCIQNENGLVSTTASASWWVLFMGVRQVITWWLARLSDLIILDWFVLQHATVCRLLGPRLSLILVQSKGWPSLLFWWMVWDAMLLYGNSDFHRHWLYFQKSATIFTDVNPAGNVSKSNWFRVVLISGVVVSVAVSIKRHILALYLGQRLYTRFNERLQDVMKKIGLISDLALWSRRKRKRGSLFFSFLKKESVRSSSKDSSQDLHFWPNAEGTAGTTPSTDDTQNGEASDPPSGPLQPGADEGPSISDGNIMALLLKGGKIDYGKILEPWSEPEERSGGMVVVSGNHIIKFRQDFSLMTKDHFFSSAFGSVESREDCVQSAERVYERLRKLMGDGDEDEINVNDLTRWMYGGLQNEKEKASAAELIELLSPDVHGCINLLEFIKAVDQVYKEVRLLENAINNASDIDRSYEHTINFFFYFFLFCIVLVISDVDVLALIISISSLIVAFSFMIGPGSAQIFEGILLVLARQPYDVGDRVAVNNVEDNPNSNGSTQWMIEGIDLITTTARLTGTGEIATFSNGSIARCRIINMNRSPHATVYVYVRFGTEIPYSTILIFRSAVEQFVRDRPQEWRGSVGFRTTRIESQENFVEYGIVLEHLLSWQNLGPILDSKAAVASFCVELQTQMNCRYIAPFKPIEILHQKSKVQSTSDSPMDNNVVPAEDDQVDKVKDGPIIPKPVSMEMLMESAKLFDSERESEE